MAAAASGTSRGDGDARRGGASALAVAGVAALLASSCCVLPLVLAIVGVSGAWMSRLRWIEPYSPGIVVLSFASLAWAGWRLYRPPARASAACGTVGGGDGNGGGGGAACRTAGSAARRWFWVVAVLALVPLVVPLLAPMFY